MVLTLLEEEVLVVGGDVALHVDVHDGHHLVVVVGTELELHLAHTAVAFLQQQVIQLSQTPSLAEHITQKRVLQVIAIPCYRFVQTQLSVNKFLSKKNINNYIYKMYFLFRTLLLLVSVWLVSF